MRHTVAQPVYFIWQCDIRYHDQCNIAIYITVPQPVYFTWQCAMWYHDQCNLAMCHAVPQPVYFTWQCLIRYQNQCLSPGNGSCVPRPVQPGNVSYGTTTSVFHLAMCNAVQRPVPFTWQCHAVPRTVQPSNMSYDTTTSVFHLTICHTVSQPVYFTWQYPMWYHKQCLSP